MDDNNLSQSGEPRIRGRFAPGHSGNPAGRPVGRSKSAKFRALFEEHAETAVKLVKEKALAGDRKMLELWIDRICPAYRRLDPPIAMPGVSEARSIQDCVLAVMEAAERGELSANDFQRLLQGFHAALSVEYSAELKGRIAMLEKMQRETGNKSSESFSVSVIEAKDAQR